MARIRINTLASRSGAKTPLPTSQTLDTVTSSPRQSSDSPDPDEIERLTTPPPPKSSPRVQFSSNEPQDKLLSAVIDLNSDEHSPSSSLNHPRSPSDSLSDISIESTVGSPVIRAITSRLSFWKKPIFPPTPERENIPSSVDALPEEVEELLMQGKEPEEVLASILTPQPEQPVLTEDRHSELEEKIVRECIKEFTKGGMYFAYNFGKLAAVLIPFIHNSL